MKRMIAGAEPWSVEPESFPVGSSPEMQLRHLVRYAILAPSGHNTQPWLMRTRGDTLDLLADRTRALSVVDPHDRALVISCGAALENLLIAGEHHGLVFDVTRFAEATEPDLLARVHITGRKEPDGTDESLFGAIVRRRTNRRSFAADVPARDVLEQAAAEAERRGCGVHLIVEDEGKRAVAALVAEGDRRQLGDVRFRRELASWIHSRRSATRDGLSGYAMGMPDALSAVGALIVRTFDMGKEQAAHDRDLAERSPALAALTTVGDGPADWLDAGQGLERLLLSLTAAGLSASYLNQPIEVDPLRPQLAEVLGTRSHPQILLRIGRGPEIEPAARRAVEDVIVDS
jgi:hypothetical protein